LLPGFLQYIFGVLFSDSSVFVIVCIHTECHFVFSPCITCFSISYATARSTYTCCTILQRSHFALKYSPMHVPVWSSKSEQVCVFTKLQISQNHIQTLYSNSQLWVRAEIVTIPHLRKCIGVLTGDHSLEIWKIFPMPIFHLCAGGHYVGNAPFLHNNFSHISSLFSTKSSRISM